MIDEIFTQIDDILYNQRRDKPDIDRGAKNESVTQEFVKNIKDQRIKRYIDVGVNRLSELLGLTISRLVNNKENTMYNTYSLEDSLFQSVKFALRDESYSNEKHIMFYLNDKKRYPIEFFKLYLMNFTSSDLSVELLEINFVEKEEHYKTDWNVHKDYRFDTVGIRDSKFWVNTEYMKSIDIEFEDSIQNYSIEAKMYLTMYQLLYKGILCNNETFDNLSRKTPILITADN